MTAKFNADILARLGEATPEEISAALAAIREDSAAYRDQPPTAETIAALNELVTAARTLNAETSTRAQLATQQAQQLADLDSATTPPAPVEPPAPAPAAVEPPAPVEPAAAALGDGTDDNDDDNEGDGDGNDDGDQGGEDSVTASNRRPLGGMNKPPANAPTRLPSVRLRTTAAAGVAGVNPGDTLDQDGLVQALADRVRSVTGMRRANGYERYTVATVRSEYPEDRRLQRGVEAGVNQGRINAVVAAARGQHARDNLANRVQVRSGPDGANALTAAGLCAPLETLYDIPVVGDTDRPIRDALVRFGADRGGIVYRPALDAVTQASATGVWTAANDEADPLVPKTCVEFDCPDVVQAEVDAIYQCMTFSNMSTQFDPEWYAATVQAQDVVHARFSENRLYTQLVAGSKALYSERTLGATRDILFTLDKMTAYVRNVHRYNDEIPLRWIAPAWAQNLMRADITRQMVGDGLQSLAVTDQEIARWLAERNINVTWHLDGIDPADITQPTPDIVVPAQFYTLAATGSLVPPFPVAISSLLFPEGDWLHLDGGTLDMGVVRDSTLNGLNRFQTFTESFETVAFRGVESVHLVIPALPTGESAATADTTP
jgi:hypothetical protein